MTENLDLALADFQTLPADSPERHKRAAGLVWTAFATGALGDRSRMLVVRDLIAVADADPQPSPDWPATAAAARAMCMLNDATHGTPGFRLDAAIEEATGFVAIAAGREPYASATELALAGLRQLRAGNENDIHGGSRAAQDVNKVAGRMSANGMAPQASVLSLVTEFQTAMRRMDIPVMRELWPRLRAVTDDPAFPAADRASVDQLVRMLAPGMTRVLGTAPVADEETGLLPGESVSGWANRAVDRARDLFGRGEQDEAIALLTDVVDRVNANDPMRRDHLMMLGSALVSRNAGDDLRHGTDVLEQAHSGSPHDMRSRFTARELARAYRRAGRLELARETAIDGLRGHGWNALAQPDPASVHSAARGAFAFALEVALICLQDNDVERAVTALEYGRALILFSARENRDLEARLLDAGSPELARQWRTEPSDELRRKVIRALPGVVDPPELPEIRAALVRLGMDVLVYLVPGNEGAGAAVVVPADDAAVRYALPGLRIEKLTNFDGFLAASARGMRDLEAVGVSATPLNDVCEWAWDVAIGPLRNVLTGKRVVLVPMWELARVPWHAARDRETGEHAIGQMTFSYTPSARLMCENAWRAKVSPDGDTLVVADPETGGLQRDLAAARAEAVAIAEFYPRARYVGRLPDGSDAANGRGTKDELAAWLGQQDTASVLHLACHGVMQAGADESSYLVLADGIRFAAEELVTTLGRDIGLAVLAACSSAESGRGYDEAFSIGSAFLAANVRTVISTQWSVPDAPTSVLMYMHASRARVFHHYLRELPPVDALRAAQLWALHDRTPPDSMPAPLREYLTCHDITGIAAWAGFVHSGQ